jgi:hypothetical protein
MTTPINGVADGATGTGVSCCTLTGGTRHVKDMKLGPDGNGWVLLSADEVADLCNTPRLTLRHVAKTTITHLCAAYGTWALEVFTSSLPRGVVFLHIKSPSKLDKVMGEQEKGVYKFTGQQLLDSYKHADYGVRAPRVWRRTTDTWDELAINFCLMTHLAVPIPSRT